MSQDTANNVPTNVPASSTPVVDSHTARLERFEQRAVAPAPAADKTPQKTYAYELKITEKILGLFTDLGSRGARERCMGHVHAHLQDLDPPDELSGFNDTLVGYIGRMTNSVPSTAPSVSPPVNVEDPTVGVPQK